MKPGEHTLAELLKENGYRTGHFGKWHLGTLTKTERDANRGGKKGAKNFSPPWINGFDTCFSTESKVPTWDPLLVPKTPTPGNKGTWWNPVADEADAVPYGTRYWNEKGEPVTENTRGDDSRVLMDRAVPFIRDSASEKAPFFAVIWFHAPHLPVVAGPEYAALYQDIADPYARSYYGCITALDEQVGRLRAELRELGVADNTMLWFCSDNGPEGKEGQAPGSAGDFRGRKRSLYEGGVRVPALVEWPGIAPVGQTLDFPAATTDYLPTILATLGIPYPDKRPRDGIDLTPALTGAITTRPRMMGFQSAGVRSLVDQRFKLIGSGKKDFELYDLLADPGETTDLAPREKSIVAQMTEKLENWTASCKASDTGQDEAAMVPAPDEKPLFRFGVIADCQYADADATPIRLYRLASEKLAESVDFLNTQDLAFTIHLGDFIDRDFISFDTVAPIYDRLQAPHYHLLGNHDYSVDDALKTKVPARLGMPARYHTFTENIPKWRFIVLDGNEVGVLAHPKDSPEYKEGEAIRLSYPKPPPEWSGGMGPEQIAWLDAELSAARDAGEKALLFCHYPLFPEGVHNLWNDTELLALVARHKDTVAAWMNGHNHDGNYGAKDGVHFVNFKGMLDTRLNAYAVVEVYPNALKITGYGREPDRVLPLLPR